MKNSLLIIAFLLVLFVGNAQDKGQNISTKTATNTTKAKSDNPTSNNLADNDLNKKLRDLEIKIKDLQAQIDGQNSKTRFAFMQISSNPIFNTAFEDFLFASDDLWNSTVDVGLAECSKACQKESSKRTFYRLSLSKRLKSLKVYF